MKDFKVGERVVADVSVKVIHIVKGTKSADKDTRNSVENASTAGEGSFFSAKNSSLTESLYQAPSPSTVPIQPGRFSLSRTFPMSMPL